MTGSGALALAAGLLMGLPQPAHGSRILWAGLCDAAHPGTQIPIPLDPDRDRAPAKGCHAACSTFSDRRTQRSA